ncbi:MAG: dephospho-CoA kinase [Gammaproteobacteria bacterium]|nr:dephospho-CoA kinase [Gammaproteobacteria bacterium]
MLRIGLTGGIGSGKTLVSNHFQTLGIPIIDTDVLAHELVVPGAPAFQQIRDTFGSDMIAADGTLDRSALRKTVFDDPELRNRLESILHPKIRQEVEQRIRSLRAPYCVVVIPLLVESGFTDVIDRVLVVDAHHADRVRWIKHRNGLSEAQIEQIIAAQASHEARLAVADDVLLNDAGIEELEHKVEELDRQYRRLALESTGD